MFGLMHPKGCCSQKKSSWYRYHRMHYCGTCKAIGSNYGHKARLFLNYDTVFLSELLSQLGEEELADWAGAYQAINRCFTMPKKADETAFSLEYAAAANTVLSALKVDDNIKDQKKWRWSLVNLLCKGSFKKAFGQFEQWGIKKELFLAPITQQYEREKGAVPKVDILEEHLNYYAQPTAELTALIFENGAQRTNPIHSKTAKELGYKFGQLMYVLDAFEDLEEDIFTQQFNPLISWFKAHKTLTDSDFDVVREIILAAQNQVIEQLSELPLNYEELYADRLRSNIAMRIYTERYIPKTWRERLSYRWQKAKEFAKQITCDTEGFAASLKYFFVAWSVFLVPAVAGQMPKQNGQVTWEWKKLLGTIFRFGQGDGLLDDEETLERRRKAEAKKAKKRQPNPCCDCLCFDCGSGCCECGSATNETACFASDCCSSWGSCCECGSGGGECCGSCGECGGCCECASCCG